MDTGLFQIFGADDIYFTLDMLARTSSRPPKKKPVDILTSKIPFAGEDKDQTPAVPEQLTDTSTLL